MARLPAGLIRVVPPAAPADIASAEAALGRALPDAYASFLRSFDGADLFHETLLIAGVGPGAPRALTDPARIVPDETRSLSAGAVVPCAGTGQDGQAQAGSSLAYVDNGDGTLTDLNTGLTWETKTDDGMVQDKDRTYTFEEAVSLHVSALNTSMLGGFADWRVPNISPAPRSLRRGRSTS